MITNEMQKLKQQNYFPIPNAVFDLDLTDGEILVYAFLLRCEDRRTYQCHPSYTTIGRAIVKRVNSVRKYVQGLTQKGLITTEHTQIVTKSGETRNGKQDTRMMKVCQKKVDIIAQNLPFFNAFGRFSSVIRQRTTAGKETFFGRLITLYIAF